MRRAPKLVLFDLDGTLIDSQAGILGSLQHAFGRIGAELPPADVLRTWIGPPFHATFPQVLGDDAERIDAAIAHYREHYSSIGWAQHEVYAGVDAVIEDLRALGSTLAVVTTKFHVYAERIVARLPYGPEFARVYGLEAGVKHSAKAEMIARALSDFGVAANDAAMVGDRHFDIDGARANDVRSVGVLWGFGSAEELHGAGADTVVASPAELGEILLARA